MIGPRKKRSIAKKHEKHSAWKTGVMKKLTARTNLVACKNCNKFKLAHRVCPHCGWYRGKQVITIKSKKSETILDA